jgi:hypothetical protein
MSNVAVASSTTIVEDEITSSKGENLPEEIKEAENESSVSESESAKSEEFRYESKIVLRTE